jgi:hypothetical protein
MIDQVQQTLSQLSERQTAKQLNKTTHHFAGLLKFHLSATQYFVEKNNILRGLNNLMKKHIIFSTYSKFTYWLPQIIATDYTKEADLSIGEPSQVTQVQYVNSYQTPFHFC